jgi:hypothetical protein
MTVYSFKRKQQQLTKTHLADACNLGVVTEDHQTTMAR